MARLIVPRSAAPKYRCRVCPEKKAFYDGEERQYVNHVVACARQHEAELHALSPKSRMPILHDSNEWDAELEDWVERKRRELIEGRLSI